MSRPITLAVVAAACMSLGGCAHRGDTAPGFAWSFQQNPDEGVKLAYGQPHSDNVLLMMTCEPGSGRVLLSAMSGQARDHIDLAARGARERISGHSAPNLFGGHIVEGEASAATPSLAAFARTGDLAMMEGRRRIALAAAPVERADVQRFFSACLA